MQRNPFLRQVFAVTLGVSLLTSLAFADALSKEEVNSFVDRMNQAVNSNDIQAIGDCFTPDAEIKVLVDGKTLEYTPSQYMSELQSGSETAMNHTYNATVKSVEV